jgi:hypothetical protein
LSCTCFEDQEQSIEAVQDSLESFWQDRGGGGGIGVGVGVGVGVGIRDGVEGGEWSLGVEWGEEVAYLMRILFEVVKFTLASAPHRVRVRGGLALVSVMHPEGAVG